MKLQFRHILFLGISVTLLALTGCQGKEASSGSEVHSQGGLLSLSGALSQDDVFSQALNVFYTSDYNYVKTIRTYDDDTLTAETVFQGSVTADPYSEHVLVLSSTGDALWQEAYYDKKGVRLITAEGELEQPASRVYPYGYGEVLQFQENASVTDDGSTLCYPLQYTVSLGEEYGLSDTLDAVVCQQYYISKDSGLLVRIVTDTSDLSYKAELAHLMSTENISREKARELADSTLTGEEVLEIF